MQKIFFGAYSRTLFLLLLWQKIDLAFIVVDDHIVELGDVGVVHLL